MKHLPNLLTLANLFCGCIAIAYILTAQPGIVMNLGDHTVQPTWQIVYGIQQNYLGGIFIMIAAVCDMLDGMVARALKVFSPIGKDLDSLADVVSFGVAPSCIIFQLLYDALMGRHNAFEASMLGMVPAFLIACFAALRLAKYNITTSQQKGYFIGMPVPATGILVATLPLLKWFNPFNIGLLFQNVWVLYAIIVLLCWLMVSKIKFIKMVPARWSLAYAWPQLVIVVVTAAALPLLGAVAIPLAFILYVLLSIIYKHPEATETTN